MSGYLALESSYRSRKTGAVRGLIYFFTDDTLGFIAKQPVYFSFLSLTSVSPAANAAALWPSYTYGEDLGDHARSLTATGYVLVRRRM